MNRHVRWALAAALAVLFAGTGSAAVAGSAPHRAADPYCGIAWGSLPKTGGALSTGALMEARTGQHECFDRVVFEFDGPVTGPAANGYEISYREVSTEAVGLPMNPYVAGGAVLGVQLMSPAYRDGYVVAYPGRPGDHKANVVGYRTLRDLMFGGSFEGYTTFAVGVRARLPFQVTVLAGPGTHSRIVLDIAHQW